MQIPNEKIVFIRLGTFKVQPHVVPPYHYDFFLFSRAGFSEDILALNDSSVHLISLEDMVLA